MDILSEGNGVDTYSVETPMTDIVNIPEAPAVAFPEGAVRNRAATSALLQGDPTKIVDTYQRIMREAQEGKNYTHDQITQVVENHQRSGAMQGVLKVLGDKTVPLEEKKRLMDFVRTGNFKEEPAVTLQAASLSQPSKGEDLRGEGARISLADALGEMDAERQNRQKHVNGLMASLPDVGARFFTEVGEAEVMPFGRNIMAAKIANNLNKDDSLPSRIGQFAKNFLLPGSAKADIQKKLNNIPPERREAFTKNIIDSIQKSATVFHSDNYYSQYKHAVELLENPIATKGEEWAENVMTLLDGFWVADAAKGLTRASSAASSASGEASRARRPGSANPGVSDAENVVHKADWELVDEPVKRYPPSHQLPSNTKRLPYNKEADTIKRIELNSVVRRENPVAPYSVVEHANPAQAAELHKEMVENGDEFAKAMTGVNKEQALANNIYPQVATESESVLAKANVMLEEQLGNTGATRYTPQELDSATNTITNDFRSVTGMEINDAMTTFRTDGDHMLIDAHYAPRGGSWDTPEVARAQAEYALRKYGIKDEEIVVMKRQGLDYVPASDNAPGDYIVKVKSKYKIRDDEVQSWNPLDVKMNVLDRVPMFGNDKFGSAQSWLLDPGSMLHPTLTTSMSAAVDQAIVLENFLLTPIKELRDTIAGMPKARRTAIEDFIREANYKGLKHDEVMLANRGFNDTEIEALKKWRDIWDGHFYLENLDVVKTLNSQGYQVLDSGGTKLFAKPVPKNQNLARVYDPASDTVRVVPKDEMDALYNLGGSFARLRRPMTVNGEAIEHIMVRNNPSEYLRRIRETDSVLNYRDGYYTVNYKAPHFIDELTVDAAGKQVKRTVGVAGSMKDADTFIKSREATTGNRHIRREDSRGFRKDQDTYWDLNESKGRIAQRRRGKPLEDASGLNDMELGPHVENPLESATRSARSIAGRTLGRDALETAKQRFVSQYSDLLKPSVYGEASFPRMRGEIVDHTDSMSKRVADARTTYDYIKMMEDGYVNSIDEGYKYIMNLLANQFDKMPLAEKALRKAGDVSPSNLAKATVFRSYIAYAMPVRQWIVQSHQVVRTVAYNPVGWATGKVPALIGDYLAHASGLGAFSKEGAAFAKFVEDSGIVAGVDKNTLVRGIGMEMTDANFGAKRVLKQAADFPMTVGFDLGEKMNQLGHLAAVYEKEIREGRNMLDKTLRDEAYGKQRALGYNMNKAGELGYTQSSPAMFMQFMQIPQKSFLQLTNRTLSAGEKARLIGWDMFLFGAPTGLLTSIICAAGGDGEEILPDNPELRDAFVSGAEAWAMNKFLSDLDESGDKTRIDFSALAPYDLDGWARMYHSFLDDGYFGAFASSPAGQLFAVDGMNGSTRNGRIPQAMLTMGRFFNVFDEVDPDNPTSFTAVINDAAKITSGWSNASNAMVMLETRKKMDAMGVTVDGSLTAPEIGAAFLGFGTRSTKELYEISRHRAEDQKRHEEDVMSRYRDITRYYAQALNEDKVDLKHVQAVSSMLMRTFKDKQDLDLVRRQWQKDMLGKEEQLFRQMMKASSLPDARRLEADIKMWPVRQEMKDQVLQRLHAIRAQRAFNAEQEGN